MISLGSSLGSLGLCEIQEKVLKPSKTGGENLWMIEILWSGSTCTSERLLLYEGLYFYGCMSAVAKQRQTWSVIGGGGGGIL